MYKAVSVIVIIQVSNFTEKTIQQITFIISTTKGLLTTLIL